MLSITDLPFWRSEKNTSTSDLQLQLIRVSPERFARHLYHLHDISRCDGKSNGTTMVGSFRTGGHDAGWSDGSGCGCLEPLMKYPPESLTLIAHQKLPKPNRKGSSSNHHFSGVKMLNFRGVNVQRHRIILLKSWDFRVENDLEVPCHTKDAIVTIRIGIHFEEGIPIIVTFLCHWHPGWGGDLGLQVAHFHPRCN